MNVCEDAKNDIKESVTDFMLQDNKLYYAADYDDNDADNNSTV